MGNPMWSYREALETMCYALNFEDKVEKMKYSEDNAGTIEIEALESEVDRWRKIMHPNTFNFLGGRVSATVFERISREDGCDAMNASVCGLSSFEDFITGVEEE